MLPKKFSHRFPFSAVTFCTIISQRLLTKSRFMQISPSNVSNKLTNSPCSCLPVTNGGLRHLLPLGTVWMVIINGISSFSILFSVLFCSLCVSGFYHRDALMNFCIGKKISYESGTNGFLYSAERHSLGLGGPQAHWPLLETYSIVLYLHVRPIRVQMISFSIGRFYRR